MEGEYKTVLHVMVEEIGLTCTTLTTKPFLAASSY